VVDGAAAAIDFYVAAFGAVEHHRLVGDDGRIGHAELFFGSTPVSLADEYPEYGVFGPITRGGTSTSFNLAVDDADAVFAHALALGATEVRPVADQFHGHRRGVLRDPWGHEWGVSAAIAGFDEAQYIANSSAAGFEWQPGERERRAGTAGDAHQLKHYGHGDLYYFTLPTADLAKAQAFYGAVLGWRFDDPDNGHVGNISAPPGSAYGNTTTTELYFVVDDIHAAVAAVRAHGGTALDPVHYDSGWAAECTDDQGTRFHLSVPADKYRL
jgi:PhnB protein